MKNIFLFWGILLTALLLVQCDKLPRNGWLDGQWQLVAIDGADMRSQRIYWRFQLDLLQFYSPIVRLSTDIGHHAVMGRFEHRGEELLIPHAYLVIRSEGRDSLITPDMNLDLSPLGVYRLPISYRIVAADQQHMRLKSDKHFLVFRKF